MNRKWYSHVNLKPQGPFTQEEVRAKIHSGEIGPQDLISDESGAWKPAVEWGVFEFTLFPSQQGFIVGDDLNEKVQEWVLLVEKKGEAKPLQEGPFSLLELRDLLKKQAANPYQYVWKPGLSGWSQIKDRPEFAGAFSSERLSNPSPV